MPTQVTDNTTLEQLEAAPTGSTLKDCEGDRAAKRMDGAWVYSFGGAYSSSTIYRLWSPIRLAQPEGADQ